MVRPEEALTSEDIELGWKLAEYSNAAHNAILALQKQIDDLGRVSTGIVAKGVSSELITGVNHELSTIGAEIAIFEARKANAELFFEEYSYKAGQVMLHPDCPFGISAAK